MTPLEEYIANREREGKVKRLLEEAAFRAKEMDLFEEELHAALARIRERQMREQRLWILLCPFTRWLSR